MPLLHERERNAEDVRFDLRPEPARRAAADHANLGRREGRIDPPRGLEVAGVLVGDALEERPVEVLVPMAPGEADPGARDGRLVRADAAAEMRDADEILAPGWERRSEPLGLVDPAVVAGRSRGTSGA